MTPRVHKVEHARFLGCSARCLVACPFPLVACPHFAGQAHRLFWLSFSLPRCTCLGDLHTCIFLLMHASILWAVVLRYKFALLQDHRKIAVFRALIEGYFLCILYFDCYVSLMLSRDLVRNLCPLSNAGLLFFRLEDLSFLHLISRVIPAMRLD